MAMVMSIAMAMAIAAVTANADVILLAGHLLAKLRTVSPKILVRVHTEVCISFQMHLEAPAIQLSSEGRSFGRHRRQRR